MNRRAAFRGQPVLVLLLLIGGWIAFRAIAWQLPPSLARLPAPIALAGAEPGARHGGELRRLPGQDMPGLVPANPAPLPASPAFGARSASLRAEARPVREPVAPLVAVRQNLMLMASFTQVPLPLGLAQLVAPMLGGEPAQTPAAAPFPVERRLGRTAAGDRWSLDSWLLLREDTTSAVTSGRGSYGQSQLGSVLRFRLAPDSPHRPTAYVRASQAFGGAGESEAALGLSARPVRRLPLAAAAELRVTHSDGQTFARPAGYLVTELPPFALPLDLTGEAYAQAGYVGGHYATGFVDGQLRAEREIVRLGEAQLRAGGGAWGGAQKGAARLDIGPSASLALKLGSEPANPVRARISMDWRFRVAGEANPASGPALTISAGF